MEEEKRVTANDYFIICKRCLNCFLNNKLAKVHKCENNQNFNEVENLYLLDLIKDNKKLDREYKKMKEKIADLENKLKIEYFKKDLMIKLVEQINKGNEYELESIRQNISKSPGKMSPPREERKKKEHYISANKIVDKLEVEKSTEEKKEIAKNVEKELEEKGKKFFDETLDSLSEIIKESFIKFETDRKYDNLKIIMSKRKKMFKFIGYDDYINILNEHYQKFQKIVEKNRMTSVKNKILKDFFSVFESRLIGLDIFINVPVESDEIERFHIGLEIIKNKNADDYKIFNKIEFLKNILTYDLAVNSINGILQRELNNSFHNLVWLENGETKDPFSFYVLEKIDKTNKRCWKMDCRLEELSNELLISIIDYCIILFRKLYILVFKDNDFRDNFLETSSLMELEGKQIIKNIMLVSDYYKVVKLFQKNVIEKCTYNATENDKFHLRADDKFSQKNFQKISQTDFTNDILQNVCALFDNPNKIDIENFINTKLNI
jgi:hypothetical protein